MALSTAHLQITKGAGLREKKWNYDTKNRKEQMLVTNNKDGSQWLLSRITAFHTVQLPIVVSKRRNKRIEHVQECRAILVQ